MKEKAGDNPITVALHDMMKGFEEINVSITRTGKMGECYENFNQLLDRQKMQEITMKLSMIPNLPKVMAVMKFICS